MTDLKPLHELRARAIAVGVFELDRRPLEGGPWEGAMVRIGSGEALQLASWLTNAVAHQMPDAKAVDPDGSVSQAPPSS